MEESKYFVMLCTQTNERCIYSSVDAFDAYAHYEHEVELAGEPVDATGWTDNDQAWSKVYHLEIIELTTDENGDIIREETIESSPYFLMD